MNDSSVPEAQAESQSLRALTPGAFLRGELEIKEVIARGNTNLYLADAGGYGVSDLKLIAERAIPIEIPEAERLETVQNDLQVTCTPRKC